MKETITFIGNGNMALSIAQGLKNIFDIEVVGRTMDKLDKFETNIGMKIKKAVYEDFDMSNKKTPKAKPLRMATKQVLTKHPSTTKKR